MLPDQYHDGPIMGPHVGPRLGPYLGPKMGPMFGPYESISGPIVGHTQGLLDNETNKNSPYSCLYQTILYKMICY
jgi:hypothetical protein